MNNILPIAKLINYFTKLPGVGAKTAQRYAYKIINMPPEDVRAFADALVAVTTQVKFCAQCGNFTDVNPCRICQTRNHQIICVVKEPKDVVTLERVRAFNGVYHVLHGTLSPIDGIGPDDITIKQLLGRVNDKTQEVIVALNPDVEGEATALYIARLLKPLGVKTTRLAQGIPIGSDIEYADEITLTRALESRKEIL